MGKLGSNSTPGYHNQQIKPINKKFKIKHTLTNQHKNMKQRTKETEKTRPDLHSTDTHPMTSSAIYLDFEDMVDVTVAEGFPLAAEAKSRKMPSVKGSVSELRKR